MMMINKCNVLYWCCLGLLKNKRIRLPPPPEAKRVNGRAEIDPWIVDGKGVQGEMTWHYDTYTVATQSTHPPLGRPPRQPKQSIQHTEGNRLDYDSEQAAYANKHYVTPLDSSALDDAASMAGFAQITAEGAGGRQSMDKGGDSKPYVWNRGHAR